MTVQSIISEALKLPTADQLKIIDELTNNIDEKDPKAWLTPEQAADLEMRIAEVEAGTAKRIDADEVFARMRKMT